MAITHCPGNHFGFNLTSGPPPTTSNTVTSFYDLRRLANAITIQKVVEHVYIANGGQAALTKMYVADGPPLLPFGSISDPDLPFMKGGAPGTAEDAHYVWNQAGRDWVLAHRGRDLQSPGVITWRVKPFPDGVSWLGSLTGERGLSFLEVTYVERQVWNSWPLR